MTALLTDLLIYLTCLYAFVFCLSIILKRNDIADVTWGLAGALISGISYWKIDQPGLVNRLATGAVILWGLRLAGHLALRQIGTQEDARYAVWREQWGRIFWIRSFFQVYVLQMILILIVCLPILVTNLAPQHEVSLWIYGISGIWLFGFIYESLADWQKLLFKKNPSNAGRFIQTGLWAYSRHPNYFGELVMWWALAALAMSYSGGVFALFGASFLTFLLVRVSGVPMAEERLKSNPDYQAYVASTPAIVPFLLRK